MVTRLALVFLASQVVGTFSLPISEPQVAQEPFTLFAWGNGIPGLPLLYADGELLLYIKDSEHKLTGWLYRKRSLCGF